MVTLWETRVFNDHGVAMYKRAEEKWIKIVEGNRTLTEELNTIAIDKKKKNIKKVIFWWIHLCELSKIDFYLLF